MKLVSWNIQWGRGADGRIDLDRMVADARGFSDFDVLCLQEVSAGYPELPGGDGSDQFDGIARRLPGFAAIPGIATNVPHPSGGRRGFGNMILSRFPVLQVFPHLLPWPADPGVKSMQRLALEATLDTPLGLVRITTAHLEYYSAKQRQAQVARLRELHREAVAHARNPYAGKPADGPFFAPPRGAAAILAGDFNFLPESVEHTLLTSAVDDATLPYRDAWDVLHPGQARPATVGLYDKQQWPGEPFAFDFIFVSEDLAGKVMDMRVDSSSRASDHQPVLIELC